MYFSPGFLWKVQCKYLKALLWLLSKKYVFNISSVFLLTLEVFKGLVINSVLFFILKGLDRRNMVLVLLVLCLRVPRYWDCLVLSLLVTNQQILKSAQDKNMKFHMLLPDSCWSRSWHFLSCKQESVSCNCRSLCSDWMNVHSRCFVKHFCHSVYFKGELKSYSPHAPLKL